MPPPITLSPDEDLEVTTYNLPDGTRVLCVNLKGRGCVLRARIHPTAHLPISVDIGNTTFSEVPQ